MGQSNSPSENYLFLNVMVNFVIVNQKLTGSALHIEKNQTIQAQKRARSLKFRIEVEEELHYPSSENKGADQLRLCFRLCRLLVFP